jgi:uncharacterized membrane protein
MGIQTELAPEPTPTRTDARRWWWLVLAGGLLGIVGRVWRTIERRAYGSGDKGPSVCDISAIVSCTNVYSHWQSSALGVPNSLIGLPVFAFVTSAAIAALLGTVHSTRYVAVVWGLAVFMTLFAVWYMEQTATSIGSLCLFCTASLLNIMLAGVGLTRVVDAHGALGAGRAGQRLHRLVDSWADVALWVGLAFAVAAMLFVGLVL